MAYDKRAGTAPAPRENKRRRPEGSLRRDVGVLEDFTREELEIPMGIAWTPGAHASDAPNFAFDKMQEVTRSAPDRLFKDDRIFTESEYNTMAGTSEKLEYDDRAFSAVWNLWQEDRKRSPNIKDWDFERYLTNLSNEYLELKLNPDDPKTDWQSDSSDLLRNVLARDVEQLTLSAWNASQPKDSRQFYSTRDRSNVSIKSPGAGVRGPEGY